jgi:hypothetical protein
MLSRLFITIIFFAGSMPAMADALYLGGISEHFSSGENFHFNERHSLLAMERDQWIAAYFDNSYGEDTFAAGYHFGVLGIIRPKKT